MYTTFTTSSATSAIFVQKIGDRANASTSARKSGAPHDEGQPDGPLKAREIRQMPATIELVARIEPESGAVRGDGQSPRGEQPAEVAEENQRREQGRLRVDAPPRLGERVDLPDVGDQEHGSE